MPDYYQLELWTSDPSPTSSQATSPDTASVISSPASAVGLMPSSLPDGAAQSGRAHVPVSRSLPPLAVQGGDLQTSFIFGRSGKTSSLQHDLAWSLASRLPKRLTGMHSSAMTW